MGWCYWIQTWAGNAPIVASWVFYVNALFGFEDPSGLQNWGIALIGVDSAAAASYRAGPQRILSVGTTASVSVVMSSAGFIVRVTIVDPVDETP